MDDIDDDDLDDRARRHVKRVRREAAGLRARLSAEAAQRQALAQENEALKTALGQTQAQAQAKEAAAVAATTRAEQLVQAARSRAEADYIARGLRDLGVDDGAARKLVPVVRAALPAGALAFSESTLDVTGDIATVLGEVKADFWKDSAPPTTTPGASGQPPLAVPVAIPGIPMTGQTQTPSRQLTPQEQAQAQKGALVASLAMNIRAK
jgi:hypothetical protein